MENATSIYNLQQQDRQQDESQRKMPVPVMSYSDVLKNMKEETVAPVSQAQPVVPPQSSPVIQFQPPVMQQPVEPLSEKNTEIPEDFQSKSFQNDMLVLLSVYIIVHMASVQKWIQTKVPNLINPDGAMSVLGLLMNGVLVIVMWNISKKMVTKYLKEL